MLEISLGRHRPDEEHPGADDQRRHHEAASATAGQAVGSRRSGTTVSFSMTW